MRDRDRRQEWETEIETEIGDRNKRQRQETGMRDRDRNKLCDLSPDCMTVSACSFSRDSVERLVSFTCWKRRLRCCTRSSSRLERPKKTKCLRVLNLHSWLWRIRNRRQSSECFPSVIYTQLFYRHYVLQLTWTHEEWTEPWQILKKQAV